MEYPSDREGTFRKPSKEGLTCVEGMLGKERFSFPSYQAEAAFSINSRSLIFNSIMKCISPIVSIHLLPHLEHAPGIRTMVQANSLCKALYVGTHPGQELRVFGWLTENKPDVFILTDGSGPKGRPRIDSSRETLKASGVVPGLLFGSHTDQAVYSRLVGHDGAFFVDLAEMIATHVLGRGINLVVAPTADGFNPVQDAIRLVVDTACRLVAQQGGKHVENMGIDLRGKPSEGVGDRLSRVVILQDDILERKLKLARAFEGLSDLADAELVKYGSESFRVEVLRRVTRPLMVPCVEPDYERHGSERVAAGLYPTVIRYSDHLAPVNWALRSHLERLYLPMSRAA